MQLNCNLMLEVHGTGPDRCSVFNLKRSVHMASGSSYLLVGLLLDIAHAIGFFMPSYNL